MPNNASDTRLLIVSNRLPIQASFRDGTLEYSDSLGGVATGLSSFYAAYDSIWLGWPGISSDRLTETERRGVRAKLEERGCRPVFLTAANLRDYYHGFSNNTLWPLFHYFPLNTVYEERYWKAYQEVNAAFCDEVLEEVRPGDKIWIQDYQLMLLPQMLRRKLPGAEIGFFLHIPFPSYELFRLLPWRDELMAGLLGADLIGFHTYDYVRHFLSTARRLLGYEHTFGRIVVEDHLVKVDAFPMGIDVERYASGAGDQQVQDEIRKVREVVGERKLILSVDRLDYTKGIVQRLDAYEHFLGCHPEFRERVVLILVVAPSRTRVEDYRKLKRRVDSRVGSINGQLGTVGWVPVWYLYQAQPFAPLRALYEAADVALVTPLRDGMNLIAKEFVASKTDGRGVLVLSETAGAASELVEALSVNPMSKTAVSDALHTALTMPVEEQIARNHAMQARLRRYDVVRWAEEFIHHLDRVRDVQSELLSSVLSPEDRVDLMDAYRRSAKRLLLLDYDGTLVPFASRPMQAAPDEQVLSLLSALTADSKNEVVLISGRDRATLDRWFGGLDLARSAEHGAWIRERDGAWRTVVPLDNAWKREIRPILELHRDRTPGAQIEEKEYSLVWHYRRVEPALAAQRATELKETLRHYTANLALEVREGSRVIEIKSTGVDKGRAAGHWLDQQEWPFILAIGDDWTDEDTFRALPAFAFSIRARLAPSEARFNLKNVREVRELLQELAEVA